MDLISQSSLKRIFRVTGTPENFLTALRFKVWGFNNKNDWEKQTPGDIIFFHSQGKSHFIPHPNPCIIGFGVVGNNFYEDIIPLWIDEKLENKAYPFKFNFSEIYLFSEIPVNDDWDSTTKNKFENTKSIIERLVGGGIPLAELPGFPHMGSYSTIRGEETIKQLLGAKRNFSFYVPEEQDDIITKTTTLSEFRNENESLRYATTLSLFDDIREKVINSSTAEIKTNYNLLARAEKAHFDIVSYLRLFFANKGYKVYSNNHVDLFAHNSKNSILIEAKSIENKNFKSQSRKGIIQLYEYSYFEISKFRRDNQVESENDLKLLVTSEKPADKEYIDFINSMDIKTAAVKDESFISYGQSINFNNL